MRINGPRPAEYDMKEAVEHGSDRLLRALWREHPRILEHLAFKGSGNVYRSRAA